MWNPVVILALCLCSFTNAVPLGLKQKNMPIMQEEEEPMFLLAGEEETRPEVMISRLNLPSNATSIRADITDGFSCDNKTYGYYADVENECQIFHVCLPVTYADGKENTFRWSFICPEETVFSQDSFTCMRPEDMSIDCEESFKYYELNRNFGIVETEDSLTSAEEEMNVEENQRLPPSLDALEDNRQTLISSIVKKPIVKAQNSNRRKTQPNRIAVEAHRKKVQSLRKTPQPVVAVQTAKPMEDEAPVMQQEVERTTVKYQRFTKRPSTIVKEQPKPEAAKPEQQIVRQDLFTQKRKRPQIYPGTRLEAPVQIEVEPEAETSLKSGLAIQADPEPVPQAEAQASEIAEVSVKPQEEEIAESAPLEAEKTEMLAVKNEEPILVQVPEDAAQVELESEIAPMPENTPSRAEVIEIPIQKADEPLVVEEPAVVVPMPEEPMSEEALPEEPMPVEPMPAAETAEPIKAEEEVMANEEQLAEETVQSELSKVPENVQESDLDKMAESIAEELQMLTAPELPKESEKVLLEPLNEPATIQEGSEPEELLDTVKAEVMPAVPIITSAEPVKALLEPEMSMAAPEMPAEAEAPVPEAEMPAMAESPAADDTPQNENEAPLRLEIAEAVPELEVAKSEAEKPAEAELPMEPEMLLKSDIPAAAAGMQPEAEAAMPVMPAADESPAPEMPLVVELPTYMAATPEKSEDESMPQPEIPAETLAKADPEAEAQPEIPEETKAVEIPAELMLPEEPKAEEAVMELQAAEELKPVEALPEPEAAEELRAEEPKAEEPTAEEAAPAPVESPEAEMPAEAEIAPEPVNEIAQPMPAENEQPEPQLEKLSESQPEIESQSAIEPAEAPLQPLAEEAQLPAAPVEEAQSLISAEDESQASSSEAEDAQTLILDFISSLVNSESSNLEGMKVNMDELPAESAPEPEIAEPKLPEQAPAENPIEAPVEVPVMAPVEAPLEAPVEEPVQTPAEEQSKPLYMPLMPGMNQGFQIPVQVIESAEPEPLMPALSMPVAPVAAQPQKPLSIDDVVELVKGSLDTPAEKEKLIQEPEPSQSESQAESEEVKPIYHRYIELGSNLLKSEALTASDEDEPTIVAATNDDSMAQEDEQPAANINLSAQEEEEKPAAELPKASEPQPEPEQLAAESEPALNILPQADGLPSEPASAEESDRLPMSRSLNRFRMDPRKRRFLFRSDAS